MATYTTPLTSLDSAQKMLLLAGGERNLLVAKLTGPQLASLDADAAAAGMTRSGYASRLIAGLFNGR